MLKQSWASKSLLIGSQLNYFKNLCLSYLICNPGERSKSWASADFCQREKFSPPAFARLIIQLAPLMTLANLEIFIREMQLSPVC